jgi:hypothetical protein
VNASLDGAGRRGPASEEVRCVDFCRVPLINVTRSLRKEISARVTWDVNTLLKLRLDTRFATGVAAVYACVVTARERCDWHGARRSRGAGNRRNIPPCRSRDGIMAHRWPSSSV